MVNERQLVILVTILTVSTVSVWAENRGNAGDITNGRQDTTTRSTTSSWWINNTTAYPGWNNFTTAMPWWQNYTSRPTNSSWWQTTPNWWNNHTTGYPWWNNYTTAMPWWQNNTARPTNVSWWQTTPNWWNANTTAYPWWSNFTTAYPWWNNFTTAMPWWWNNTARPTTASWWQTSTPNWWSNYTTPMPWWQTTPNWWYSNTTVRPPVEIPSYLLTPFNVTCRRGNVNVSEPDLDLVDAMVMVYDGDNTLYCRLILNDLHTWILARTGKTREKRASDYEPIKVDCSRGNLTISSVDPGTSESTDLVFRTGGSRACIAVYREFLTYIGGFYKSATP